MTNHLTNGQLLSNLADLGVISRQDFERLKAANQLRQVAAFTRSLVAQKKLTDYQADLLLDGRGDTLILGNYAILEKLGQGGMGVVYKAIHFNLQRVVALKTLPELGRRNQDAVRRFEREMDAIGRLDHPNVVRASDASQHNETLYLVMEYLEGKDVSSLCQQHGPLSVADACEIVRQTAEGLQYIHAHGLVHRDIKPSNLILCRSGVVKILDLGLALLLEHESLPDKLTATGSALGTVDYVAPEQVSDSHAVDIRADIYSLGCTLYRLLAAQPPFGGEKYGGRIERLMAHLREPVPSITDVRSDVPSTLVAILEKMLAKDPRRRFQGPADVRDACAAFTVSHNLPALLGGPVATGMIAEERDRDVGATTVPRLEQKPPRRGVLQEEHATAGDRRRLVMASIAISVCLLLAAAALVVGWAWHGGEPDPMVQESMAPRDQGVSALHVGWRPASRDGDDCLQQFAAS